MQAADFGAVANSRVLRTSDLSCRFRFTNPDSGWEVTRQV